MNTMKAWRSAAGALVAIVAIVTVVAMTASKGETAGSLPAIAVDAGMAEDAIAGIVDEAPIDQQPNLDGGVTLEEYAAAVDDTIACLRDAFAAEQVPVDIPAAQLSADGYEYSYHYRVGPRADGSTVGAEAASTYDQVCRAAHLDAVEQVYHLQTRANDDYSVAVDRLLKDCLTNAGVDVIDDNDPRDVAMSALTDDGGSSAASVEECIAAHPSITDVLPTEADAFSTP
jgi:hypothetical protein